jgi:hypothetical protein
VSIPSAASVLAGHSSWASTLSGSARKVRIKGA